MGFGWQDALAIANPIGWGPALYKYATEGNGYTPPGPNTRKPLMAGDVKLLDPLKAPLGGINQQGQNSLADALGKSKAQARTSQIVSGRPKGQYIGEVLGRANTMASRGIEDAVAGTLGGASLKDLQNEQEFQRNMALAQELGDLNSPSVWQEILSGLGGGAGTALQFKGLYDALNRNRAPSDNYIGSYI